MCVYLLIIWNEREKKIFLVHFEEDLSWAQLCDRRTGATIETMGSVSKGARRELFETLDFSRKEYNNNNNNITKNTSNIEKERSF